MDSQQVHRFSVASSDLSYSSSHFTPPTLPENMFGYAKFNTRNSPNSPFSTPFDCDTVPVPSDYSLEQHSFTENPSRVNPSCNPPIQANGYYYQSSPSSLDSFRVRSSGGLVISHNANGGQTVRNALMKLETALMGPDNARSMVTAPASFSGEGRQNQVVGQGSRVWNLDPQCSHMTRPELLSAASRPSELQTQQHCRPSDSLKQLLIECASALSENRLGDFEKLVEQGRSLVSISGDPVQRLGAYMIEGLVSRKESSGTSIYQSLQCQQPLGKDLLSYMHLLYEVCPYLKFGYMAANGAIAEACRNENRIHIVDFQIAQGTQWMTLLQALASRPGGPPHVRITGIDDPVSKYARGMGLEAVGRRLVEVSEKFNIPLEFHAVPVFAPKVTREMLQLRQGEALAVNFPLHLHHTPDESVEVENPRDGLLRMVKSLSPKVMTLLEQESNINTAPFLTRFKETLDYYSAMFESIDVTMPRDRKERINVEQHCLAKEIVNIIACEGKERVERHELLGKWRSRLMMAGFKPYPLSSYVNSVINGLVKCYSEHYTLGEKDGAILLGWKDRMLISASAWH